MTSNGIILRKRILASKKLISNNGKSIELLRFHSVNEHKKDIFSQDPESSFSVGCEYLAITRRTDNTFAIYDTNTYTLKSSVAFHQVIDIIKHRIL